MLYCCILLVLCIRHSYRFRLLCTQNTIAVSINTFYKWIILYIYIVSALIIYILYIYRESRWQILGVLGMKPSKLYKDFIIIVYIILYVYSSEKKYSIQYIVVINCVWSDFYFKNLSIRFTAAGRSYNKLKYKSLLLRYGVGDVGFS